MKTVIRVTEFTPDEIIEYLKTTSVPTVLVEGTTDAKIYRWIEGYLENLGFDISVMPTGGRTAIFKVHEHKNLLTQVPIVFTADLDGFLFTGVPCEKRDIVFTSGYSVENEVLDEDFFIKIMDSQERARYIKLKKLASEWFASQIDELRRTGSWSVGQSIHKSIDCKHQCHKNALTFDSDLAEYVNDNYTQLFRGKSVIDLLVNILSGAARGGDRYSSDNITSLSIVHGDRAKITALAQSIEAALRIAYKRFGMAV